jgi:hypothetical protein
VSATLPQHLRKRIERELRAKQLTPATETAMKKLFRL